MNPQARLKQTSDPAFGPLVVLETAWPGDPDANERRLYSYLAKAARAHDWLPVRIENKFSLGTPDMYVFRGVEYWAIECKVCRTKQFTSIVDSLHWQAGQLYLFDYALKSRMPYCIVVRHNKSLYYVTGESIHALFSYPDFA